MKAVSYEPKDQYNSFVFQITYEVAPSAPEVKI